MVLVISDNSDIYDICDIFNIIFNNYLKWPLKSPQFKFNMRKTRSSTLMCQPQ